MVATSNKESAKEKTATPTVSSGTGGSQAPSTPPNVGQSIKKRLLEVFWGAVVLLVIVGIFWLFNNYAGSTVFKIDGKSYSKSDIKKLVAYPTQKQHVSFSSATHQAYDALRYQTAAKKAGITVTQAEQSDYAKNTLGVSDATYKQYKSWFDLKAYNEVVALKLPSADNNREGYTYVFWFGDAIQPAFSASNRSPKYGDQQAYKADQQYASQRANYYHGQLQSKKMTPEQVLAAVKNDPRLGLNGLPGDNSSLHFGTSTDARETWELQLNNTVIANYVRKAGANSLSPVQTGTTATQVGADPGSYQNAYYYIVQMQNVQPNNGKLLKQAQAGLHAKFYTVSVWL